MKVYNQLLRAHDKTQLQSYYTQLLRYCGNCKSKQRMVANAKKHLWLVLGEAEAKNIHVKALTKTIAHNIN